MTGPVHAGPILSAGQASQLSPRCNLSQLNLWQRMIAFILCFVGLVQPQPCRSLTIFEPRQFNVLSGHRARRIPGISGLTVTSRSNGWPGPPKLTGAA